MAGREWLHGGLSSGLTEAQAAARLAEDGPNVLPSAEPRHWFGLLMDVLSEPMLLLLLGAGAIYLLLGDLGEAIAMLFFVNVIVVIAFQQERRTQRALEALRDLSAPRAEVIRDGETRRIPGAEVVRGDLVILREGDRIPADGRLLTGVLMVDESLLTGEAGAIPKRPRVEEVEETGAGTEDACLVHAGTLVAQGLGQAEIAATGIRTRMGGIGRMLSETTVLPSPLQQASRRLVRLWAAAGTGLAMAVVLLSWLWAGRELLPSVLAGLALAMAILPEEIPVVLSVFLAMGAWRMSAKGVLARQVPAVEALGAITCLAVDKTGTLTQNRMEVAELFVPDQFLVAAAKQDLPEGFHTLVEFSVLATPLDPFDPMEKALQTFADATLDGTEHLHEDWAPAKAYELSADILAMTHVYEDGAPDHHLLAAKGAPEAILDLCHLDGAELNLLLARAETMAARGLRVLGVARGNHEGEGLPASQHDFAFEFLGLIGLEDPLRPEVPKALEACRGAGIRVLMMTGDHPATALAIAGKLGLPLPVPPLTGDEVETLGEAALKERLALATVCARLRPEQKLRLVKALQAAGEVVAMTGDGVNDAPALKAAQVGVAMGARGTDVARETADLVLVDDSFASLVEGVRMGRRIYTGLARSARFVYAVHLPVLGLVLVPLLLKWPPFLLPLHIVLLELLIDPACTLVLEAEPESPGLMDRPPRPTTETPFGWDSLRDGLLQGLGVVVALVLLAAWCEARGLDIPVARGALMPSLLLGAFALVLSVRREGLGPVRALWIPNPLLHWMGVGLAALLTLMLAVPGIRSLLGIVVPHGATLLAASATVAGILLWLEFWAILARRRLIRP
ncbi:MAG: cation-translocating P-type ATPase [Holophagaceae bacterium]|nr:cation-translocating P-type ATPase [Holophagaceae bacterium]